MSEGITEGTATTGGETGTEVKFPAWMAQLPADYRQSADLAKFPTIGDLAKSYKETADQSKANQKTLENAIPRLNENPTKEEVDKYYTALGRPKSMEEYSFKDGDKDLVSPDMDKFARQTLFDAGVPQAEALKIVKSWNQFFSEVQNQQEGIKKQEWEEADKALRAKHGDKYDAVVKKAKRFFEDHSKSQFDSFVNETKIGMHPVFLTFITSLSEKYAEDSTMKGSESTGKNSGKFDPGNFYQVPKK